MFDFLSKAAESIGNGIGKVGEVAVGGLGHIAERLQDEDVQQQLRVFGAAMSDDNTRYQSALNAYDQRKQQIAQQKREDVLRAEQRQQSLDDMKRQREWNQEDRKVAMDDDMKKQIISQFPPHLQIQMYAKLFGNTPDQSNTQVNTDEVNTTATTAVAPVATPDETAAVQPNPEGYDFKGYLPVLAKEESGGDPTARNPNSTALGKYQITKATAEGLGYRWEDMADPAVAEEAVMKLTKQHYDAHVKKYGVEPTHGELYMYHQQGWSKGGKAMEFARNNPDANAVEILGEKEVLNNGGTRDMTIGEYVNKWSGKFQTPTTSTTSTQQRQTPNTPNTPATPAKSDSVNISGTGTLFDGLTVPTNLGKSNDDWGFKDGLLYNKKTGETRPVEGVKKEVKLSARSEKVMTDSYDAAYTAEDDAEDALRLAAQIQESKDKWTPGIFGNSKEMFKKYFGTADDVTLLKSKYTTFKNSEAMGHLPPGSASDSDVKTFLSGFPDSSWPAETLVSWLNGQAKAKQEIADFNRFKGEYIGKYGNMANHEGKSFYQHWKSFKGFDDEEEGDEEEGGDTPSKDQPKTTIDRSKVTIRKLP